MRIRFEDKALPIDPSIQMESWRVINDLETTFRIGCQIQFRVIQRKNQPMAGTSINIPQYEIKVADIYLSSEKGQQMDTILVMLAFPMSNILISIVRIFVSPTIP